MKIRKYLAMFLTLSMLVLLIAACNGVENDETQTPTGQETTVPQEETPNDEETESTYFYEYTPTVPVPVDLPVFPGAVLTNEISGGDSGVWSWLYSTSASGNEIVEFFIQALIDMGYEIDEDNSFALYEEFFVMPTVDVISVFWLATDEDGTNPDTPNRGYGIVVDLEEWESRE